MEQINEQWRPVEGYEGIYEVSNLGRVKSLGNDKKRKEKILRPFMNNYGYLQIVLCKEGKEKMFLVHRLVGMSFISNPEGLPQINHKDENKTNNVVFLKDDGSVDECRSNLEWCDSKYNNNYGTHTERQVQTNIRNGTYDPDMCGIWNKDKNEYDRLYYQKNIEHRREQGRERQRKYRLKNRDRINERQRKYRLRKKQSSETSLW